MADTVSELQTWRGRVAAHLHAHFKDHAFLRASWSNLHEFAPGVWRSNQPSPRRVRQFRDMGLRCILNLRGTSSRGSYVLELREARRMKLPIVTLSLSARKLATSAEYLALLDTFDRIERPFVLHCKSGADRTGLAAAFWLLHVEGQSVAAARKMLSLRYLHVRQSKTGILDFLLDLYAEAIAVTPMPLRTWLETGYDRDRAIAEYKSRKDRG